MNSFIEKINVEKVLFFDVETASKSKELDENSQEYELFRKKIRNRETDDLPDYFDTKQMYEKVAPLRLTYNQVIAIGVSFVKGEKLYVKSITGTEEEILREFATITREFEYLCGVNILKFDLPVISTNSARYFRLSEIMPDRFITSGKKPWDLKAVIDLLDVFQGTSIMYSPSMDEMCLHFNLPSPKDSFDGSMVSAEFHKNGVSKISEYVKRDAISNVNLFRAMRFEQPFTFEEAIDRTSVQKKTVNTQPEEEEERDLLAELAETGIFSEEIKNELREGLENETDVTIDLVASNLKAIYILPKDKAKTKKEKEKEVDDFFKDLKYSNYKRRKLESNLLYPISEGTMTKEAFDNLKEHFKKNVPTEEEKPILFDIIMGAYKQTDFVNNNQDSKAVIEAKEEEVRQILNM